MPIKPPAQHHAGYRLSASARGYGARWQRERRQFLIEHPLCIMCQAQGRVTPATVVDHKVPHKGDPVLMWDRANWQPLCKPHHDRDKQASDRGRPRLARTDGW